MSDFLAEARIVVRPDTSAFAAQLAAQLKAITAKPIVIPVVAAVSSSLSAATGAAGELAVEQAAARAAAQALGVANARAALDIAKLTAAETAAATATRKLAFAQEEVIGASSAVAAARVTLTRSTAAVIASEAALQLALKGTNAALTAAVRDTLALAIAQQAEATSALKAARDQAAHAASLSGLRKGIAATALELIGLRGATLAASGPFLAGAAGAIALGASLKVFANFEQELNVFQATAGASADQMQRVSDTAKELGADLSLPGVSASDAATAMTELAKAGLSVQDSLDAARGTLQLATAAQLDNATATELVANSLNAFGLAGTEATRVADLLAGAANESQGSIADMGIALRQVAPVASLVNFSIEDTVTILTQLARSGLSASDAGTSFRQALLRLIQNMPKVNAEVSRLGLNLRDAQGFIRPEVFGELQQRLNELTPAAREAAIATLGGADAIRTFGLLARAGAEDFRETKGAVTEVGLAQKLAAARTKGLKGDTEALKNEVALLGLQFGNLASGPVGVFVEGLTETAAAVNLVAGGVEDLAGHLGFLGGTLGVVGDVAKRLAFPAPLNAIKGVKALTGALRDEIDTAEEVSERVNEILSEFEKFGGSQSTSAITIATAKLGDLAEQLERGPEAGQKFVQGVQRIRSEIENRPLRLGFEFAPIVIPPNIAGDAAKKLDSQMETALGALLPQFGGQIFGIGKEAALQYVNGILAVLPNLLADVQAVVNDSFRKAVEAGRLAIGRIDSEVTDIEFQGGSDQQIRAALSRKLAAQEKLVADLEAREAQRSKIDAAKRAAIDTRERIEAIDAAAASATESAAAKSLSDARARAQALQKARDDADKAILDTFTLSRSQAQNRIAAAELTPRLSDDIRRQKELRALVLTEIKVINDRVKDEGVKKAAVAALRAIVTSTTGEIKKLVAAQKESADERRKAARDAATDILAQKLQLAELRGNRDVILAALNAAIADARKRIKAAKTQADRLDEEIHLQELINQKNELLAEKKEQGNLAARFFFEQLQAQQGFAANLLGNLIPSGQTAGLVGVPSPAAAPKIDVGVGLGAAAGIAEGKSNTSPTAGQASTTNQILRGILHQMQILTRTTEAPEAAYQNRVGRALMDNGGGYLGTM